VWLVSAQQEKRDCWAWGLGSGTEVAWAKSLFAAYLQMQGAPL
jgi:hypothetical protein